MSGQITRPAGSLALAATLLAGSVGIGMSTNAARADDCLAAPNSAAPEGSHWYYRIDRATQGKCWYVRATDQAAQQAASQATLAAASTSTPALKKPATAAGVPALVSRGGNAAVPLPPLKPQRAAISGATMDQPVRQSTREISTAPSIRPATDSATSSGSAQEASIPAIQEMFAAYRGVQAYSQSGSQAYQFLIARHLALDCQIGGWEPDTVDADLWARLKLDYERNCYEQAEILIHKRVELLAADATSNNGEPGNFRALKLLASDIADAAVDDADPAPSIVAPTVTGSVAETISSDGLAFNPSKNAKFYFGRGIASYRDGDLPVAIVDFDLATKFDPNLKDAYIDQAIALYRVGNFHRAFDVIDQAVRIESSHRACDFTAPEGVALAIRD
jgi:tetratricopeptide (TPR) repeat protein